ncbi:MAG: hypothetical protein B7Z37_27335 [Verrucomicrobia bacterium 12-59-8]|nr:MAG: hypothetical protein B7Z37_27335 [Verrucomicrobia bacterium 12-59-8]
MEAGNRNDLIIFMGLSVVAGGLLWSFSNFARHPPEKILVQGSSTNLGRVSGYSTHHIVVTSLSSKPCKMQFASSCGCLTVPDAPVVIAPQADTLVPVNVNAGVATGKGSSLVIGNSDTGVSVKALVQFVSTTVDGYAVLEALDFTSALEGQCSATLLLAHDRTEPVNSYRITSVPEVVIREEDWEAHPYFNNLDVKRVHLSSAKLNADKIMVKLVTPRSETQRVLRNYLLVPLTANKGFWHFARASLSENLVLKLRLSASGDVKIADMPWASFSKLPSNAAQMEGEVKEFLFKVHFTRAGFVDDRLSVVASGKEITAIQCIGYVDGKSL